MPASRKPTPKREATSRSKRPSASTMAALSTAPSRAHARKTRWGRNRSASISSANTRVPATKPSLHGRGEQADALGRQAPGLLQVRHHGIDGEPQRSGGELRQHDHGQDAARNGYAHCIQHTRAFPFAPGGALRSLIIMIPFSVLDLSPITEGSDAAQSFRNTLDLAQHAERWGFNRYWLAEHHGMPGIASAATAVLIGHVAGGTRTIRVGAGGIMLPNHSPLVIAEQFGTLEALYPGRIDLGLGRAPGSDQATAQALRRNLMTRRGRVPARRGGADGPDVGPAAPAHPRRARHRREGAGLDPGLQPVRRAARRHARPALCLRLAFRAGADDAGHRRSTATRSSLRRSWPSPT